MIQGHPPDFVIFSSQQIMKSQTKRDFNRLDDGLYFETHDLKAIIEIHHFCEDLTLFCCSYIVSVEYFVGQCRQLRKLLVSWWNLRTISDMDSWSMIVMSREQATGRYGTMNIQNSWFISTCKRVHGYVPKLEPCKILAPLEVAVLSGTFKSTCRPCVLSPIRAPKRTPCSSWVHRAQLEAQCLGKWLGNHLADLAHQNCSKSKPIQ